MYVGYDNWAKAYQLWSFKVSLTCFILEKKLSDLSVCTVAFGSDMMGISHYHSIYGQQELRTILHQQLPTRQLSMGAQSQFWCSNRA